MLALLTSRRFWPLLVTQFGGAFNDNLFKQSLLVLIVFSEGLRQGYDPKFLVTAAAGLFILPYLLFSSLAGQLADKYEKASLVRLFKTSELVMMVLVSVGLFAQQLGLLMLLLFAMGAQSAFYSPLKYSLLPDHLKPKELLGGNAIIEASTFLSILLGNIAGTLLITLDAGKEIVSAVLIGVALVGLAASFRMLPSGPFEPKLQISANLARSSYLLVRQVFAKPVLGRTTIAIGWFWFVGSVFVSQFPLLGKQVLGDGELLIATMLGCFSVGVAIGSFAAERLFRDTSTTRYAPHCLMVMGIATLVFYQLCQTIDTDVSAFALPQGWAMLVALMVIAISGGIYIVPLNTCLQREAEAMMRARVIAVNNIISAMFMVGASATIALLYTLSVPVLGVFFWLGVGNCLLAGYILLNHRIRKGASS